MTSVAWFEARSAAISATSALAAMSPFSSNLRRLWPNGSDYC